MTSRKNEVVLRTVKRLTKGQVVDLLKRKQGDRTARELAAELGVGESYLSEIFSGSRNPGPMILEKLGLEEESVYRQTEK